MIKIKEIKIHPSNWILDVIICNNLKQLEYISEKRYALIGDPIVCNECVSLDSGVNGELKGEKRVIVSLATLKNRRIVVHELMHSLWHISKYIGYEMSFDTQEWQAVLFEYLYKEIFDKDGYVEYHLNNQKH